MEYIITFNNTNAAIKAEQFLLREKIPITVLPLSPQIRAGCGICLKIKAEKIKAALMVLEENNIKKINVFSVTENNNKKHYREYENWGVLMEKEFDSLLANCTSGGCGAKIGPGELAGLLEGLPFFYDENLLVGYDSSDDAGVYRISEKHSIINTVDFFPPMVNDPYRFGKIAAANALSDVYAMGGRPITALNIVCFPQKMDPKVLKLILTGGAEKLQEASVVLAGGHSIYDKEPKYGLAVTGMIENDKIIRNNTPQIGHKLILTKPLGTGIIMAALRGGVAEALAVEKAIISMEKLNKDAAEKMSNYKVSACTDITGFGLLAHLLEMVSDKVAVELYENQIPYFAEAYKYAEEYILTAAGQKNRVHLQDKVNVDQVAFPMQELLFDPQTSGGLLICVAPEEADDLLKEIKVADAAANIIGQIIARTSDIVLFKQEG